MEEEDDWASIRRAVTPRSSRGRGTSPSSPKTLRKDVDTLRLELEHKKEENAALQEAFDDYVASSKELEEELEAELEKAEAQIADLSAQKASLEEKIQSSAEKTGTSSAALARAEKALEDAKAQAAVLKEHKWQLEQKNDELESSLRALESSHETVKHKLERAIEENVFLSSDMEDLKRAAAENEQRLKTELSETSGEMAALKAKIERLQSGGGDGGGGGEQTTGEARAEHGGPAAAAAAAAAGEAPSPSASPAAVASAAGPDAAATATAQLAAARERLLELELANEELREALEQAGRGSKSGTELLEALAQQRKAEKALAELREELAAQAARREAAEAALAAARAEGQAAVRSLAETAARANEEAQALGAKLGDATAELAERQELLAAQQGKVAALQARLEAEAAERAALRQRAGDARDREEALAARAAALQAQIERLSAAAAASDGATGAAAAAEGAAEGGGGAAAAGAAVAAVAAAALEEAVRGRERAEAELAEARGKLAELRKRRHSGHPSARAGSLLLSPAPPEAAPAAAPATPPAAAGAAAGARRMGADELLEATLGAAAAGGAAAAAATPGAGGEAGAAALAAELKGLQEEYEGQRLENARLLRQLQQLKGNIQVCCRIRPATAEELAAGPGGGGPAGGGGGGGGGGEGGEFPRGGLVVDALGEGEVGFWDRRGRRWTSAAFDRVWGPAATQQQVYRDVAPVAVAAADGLNACVFAYGQTGAGKTHTMVGPPEDEGISGRALRQLFALLKLKEGAYAPGGEGGGGEGGAERRGDGDEGGRGEGGEEEEEGGFEWSVRVAMLEIYNEDLRDLLAPASGTPRAVGGFGAGGERGLGPGGHGGGGGGADLTLRGGGGTGEPVEVAGLTWRPAAALGEVLGAFAEGARRRATAATGLNDRSSRSHAVLTVEVTTAEPGGLPKTGRLHLVDLAGSERVKRSGVAGAQLEEAKHINRSLAALGDVMEALDRRQAHVPYRNSRLTHLLQDALGGGALTLMVVAVCPTAAAHDETAHVLDFAHRVRHIQRAPVQRNVQTKNLQEALKRARADLSRALKQKAHAEEALALAKKEQKALATKTSAKLDNAARSKDETIRRREAKIDELVAEKEAAVRRGEAERAARSKAQAEQEELARAARRAEGQLADLRRENADLKARVADGEAQLTVAQRRLRQQQVSSRLSSGGGGGAAAGRRASLAAGGGGGGGGRASGGGALRAPAGLRTQTLARREAELSARAQAMLAAVGDGGGGGGALPPPAPPARAATAAAAAVRERAASRLAQGRRGRRGSNGSVDADASVATARSRASAGSGSPRAAGGGSGGGGGGGPRAPVNRRASTTAGYHSDSRGLLGSKLQSFRQNRVSHLDRQAMAQRSITPAPARSQPLVSPTMAGSQLRRRSRGYSTQPNSPKFGGGTSPAPSYASSGRRPAPASSAASVPSSGYGASTSSHFSGGSRGETATLRNRADSFASHDSQDTTLTRAEQALQKHKSRMLARAALQNK